MDYRRRVDLYLKELESRIAALESVTEQKSPQNEEKRLWKIRSYEIRMYGCSDYNTYFSDIKELTESEAVKWYNHYKTLFIKKGDLLYKKEGEWVTYNIGE